MADKTWILFAVPGIGQHAAWIASQDAELAEGRAECQNLTRIAFDQTGRIAFAKVCDQAVLNFSALAYWLDVPGDLKAELAKFWNTGEIIVSTDGKKILRHD